MSNDAKIQQFKTMAEADPYNELGHFSLAKAYLDAGRAAEAIASFDRVLQINAGYSKAYQLRAEAQLKLGKRDDAIATLRRGMEVADQRGDRMPQKAMADLLRTLGVEVAGAVAPAAAPAPGSIAAADGAFQCARCGRPHGKLPEPPFKGELGARIHQRVCATCWREWIGMGTKVINELGLVLSTPRGAQLYDQHMKEFLMLE